MVFFEFLRKGFKLHHLLWIFAGVCIVGGVMSLQGSYLAEDYIQVSGYIDNIEFHEEYNYRQHKDKSYYSYTFHWTINGVEHSSSSTSSVDPSELDDTFWVCPYDDSEAIWPDSPKSVEENGYRNICIGLIFLILSFIVRAITRKFFPHKTDKYMSKKEKLEKRENTIITLWTITVIIGIAAVGLTALTVFAASDMNTSQHLVTVDLTVIAYIVSIGCAIAAKKLK